MAELNFYLQRVWRGDKFTSGILFSDASGVIKPLCYSLEDKDRDSNMDGDIADSGEEKVHSQTCIPAGRYQLQLYDSPKFKRQLPLLLAVPGFEYILIHRGNTIEDTAGCILTGFMSSIQEMKIYQSADAEVFIVNMLKKHNDKSFITISYNSFINS